MPRWAKITEEIGEDEKLCTLAKENTMAALLFTWSIPKADLYAIIAGSPSAYRARVCPAMDITKTAILECIAAQVRAGFVYPYECAGKPLLYIKNYHRHQTIKWDRVGTPKYELPPCWWVPQELRQYLEQEGYQRQPAFYGLTDALEPKSRTTPGLVQDYSPLDVDVEETRGREEESLTLLEGGTSREGEPNDQHPASDSLGFNSNDDGTAIIQTAFDMLAEFAEGKEENLRTDIENLHKAYPDCVIDAAMATASTLRDGKDRKWNAHAAAYLRATASNMAADAKESNEADPARRPFVLLFGTEPRIISEASYWRDDLIKFRNAPQLFLSHKRAIMSEAEWATLEAKAIAAGVWWPGARPYLETAEQEKVEIEANPRKLDLHGRTLDEEQVARVEQLAQDIERLEKEAANGGLE